MANRTLADGLAEAQGLVGSEVDYTAPAHPDSPLPIEPVRVRVINTRTQFGHVELLVSAPKGQTFWIRKWRPCAGEDS